MRVIALFVVWLSVGMAWAGFVMPWAQIDWREPGAQSALGILSNQVGRVTAEVRRGAEYITGPLPSLQDIPKEVSGVEVPRLANRSDAKVALALVELLTNQRRDIGRKSYAVYLVPGLAALFAILLTLWGRARLIAPAIALACLAIAAGGSWKLLTTDTSHLLIAITIGPGLWLSMAAYAALALGALAHLTIPRRAH